MDASSASMLQNRWCVEIAGKMAPIKIRIMSKSNLITAVLLVNPIPPATTVLVFPGERLWNMLSGWNTQRQSTCCLPALVNKWNGFINQPFIQPNGYVFQLHQPTIQPGEIAHCVLHPSPALMSLLQCHLTPNNHTANNIITYSQIIIYQSHQTHSQQHQSHINASPSSQLNHVTSTATETRVVHWYTQRVSIAVPSVRNTRLVETSLNSAKSNPLQPMARVQLHWHPLETRQVYKSQQTRYSAAVKTRQVYKTNKAIGDIRLCPWCAIALLTVHTSLT